MSKSPRQRRREKNQEAILDAAFELISVKGIENFSLREVAKQADYSPAALYKYFDSKQAIIDAVRVRENLKLIDRLNTIDAALPQSQRLLDMCMIYILFSLERQAYLSLVNNMTSQRKSKDQSVPPNSPYTSFFQAVDEWASAEGIPLSDEYGLEEITYALWAQMHGMATLQLNQLKDFDADFDRTNRRSIEIFLSGLKGQIQ